ncbi:serine hydrolase domain-containing protein [Agromyces sp. ZXT2-6]|uniref:serine hydrolase domain-containing protein n=1 Tax=Agromyces sp. ZXT2-6 TaxID=3461153 RepID=UPI004054C27E
MTDLLPVPTVAHLPRYDGARLGEPTLDTWQLAPHNRWTFSHVDEFVPTVAIARRPATEIASGTVGIESLRAEIPGLDRRLATSFTDAFVVVQGDVVLADHYREGFGPDERHLLMSVSKSICGLTVGTLVDAGLIDPAKRVDHYVEPLTGTAYGDATVQQVLDMTVDVDYDEDYRNPASHVQAQDRVAGWRTRHADDPADTYAFLTSLRGGGAHGRMFRYCSAGTDVLAWVIENVSGRRYADAVSEQLWSRLGCDDDATITVDAGGFGFANGGISCTARDLARLGRLMLGGGELDGRRVVSAEWVRRTMAGGDPAAAAGSVFQRVHPGGSYRNQWWATGNDRGNVYAIGIHGQYVWVDPPTDTVIVKFSSWPEPVTEEWNRLHAELFRDVCEAVGTAVGS